MKIAFIRQPAQKKWAPEWMQALEDGMARHGYEVVHIQKPADMEPHPLVVVWGVRWRWAIDPQISSGKDYLVMERGYIGDRFAMTSLGFNGLNGHAEFHTEGVPSDRWERLFRPAMKPWREGGEYALLLGQVPGDMSVRGVDLPKVYQKAREDIEKHYGLPVVYREHPVSAVKRQPSLEEHLAGARFAVAINSNSLTDAVMAGVPAMSLGSGAVAEPLCFKMGQKPKRPDRSEWGREMGYRQWSLEEMRNGEAWAHLKQRYEP